MIGQKQIKWPFYPNKTQNPHNPYNPNGIGEIFFPQISPISTDYELRTLATEVTEITEPDSLNFVVAWVVGGGIMPSASRDNRRTERVIPCAFSGHGFI